MNNNYTKIQNLTQQCREIQSQITEYYRLVGSNEGNNVLPKAAQELIYSNIDELNNKLTALHAKLRIVINNME